MDRQDRHGQTSSRGEGGILENSIRGFDRFYVCVHGGRKSGQAEQGGERLSIAAEGGSKK